MVAPQKINGSSDDDTVELLHDVRSQPNADPEVVATLLLSIEQATSNESPNDDSASSTKTSSTAYDCTSYAAVLSPDTAAKFVPVETTKGTSTVEYDTSFPPLEGSEKPSINVINSTYDHLVPRRRYGSRHHDEKYRSSKDETPEG